MIDVARSNDAAATTTTSRVRAFAAVSALLFAGACATTQEAPRRPSVDEEVLRDIARERTHKLANDVQRYWFVTNEYPSEKEGLRALVSPPQGDPILDAVPRDPWGREFAYRRPGITGNEFDVYSLGPDGEPGTSDDVGSWEERRPPRSAPAPRSPSPRRESTPKGGPRVLEL